MRKLIFCGLVCACASQGAPPGGPPDRGAPEIVSITPDTGTTGVTAKQVIFKFDELVAEKPANATTLSDLFVISPRHGSSDVSWKRDEVHVRPHNGWLPNTTYTVTMLPGISDLRNNARNVTASTFFSTGTTLARATINGRVIDWATATLLPGTIIEARTMTDTTTAWIAVADSTGSFSLGHLPAGEFRIRAYVDKNRSFGIDPDEAWDSTRTQVVNSAAVQLLVYAHDTLPPQLTQAAASDSVTLLLTFDRPADSASAYSAASYSVAGSDSIAIPIAAVRHPPVDTSQHRVPMARPGPTADIELKLAAPMVAKRAYRVSAINIRGISGRTASTAKVVTYVPGAVPPVRLPPMPGGAVPITRKR